MGLMRTITAYFANQEPVDEPDEPDKIPAWVISGDAMTAEDEVCNQVRDWLIAVAWNHAKRRGSRHKDKCDYIERQDIEHGGQHLIAVMRLSRPSPCPAN